jgi:PAS domain S-box-containing protein
LFYGTTEEVDPREMGRQPTPPRDEQWTDDDPDRYRHLVEHIQDALVEFEVRNEKPIVTAVNPAFVDVFGYETGDIVGASLNAYIVPPWLEAEAKRLDERTAAGEINYQRVYRETSDGLREFLYRGIPYGSDQGPRRGFAVYTDLTETQRNQRRIDVLQRLLRHNLRNELGVLLGNLDLLAEQVDEDAEDPLAQARESAAALNRLANEAHEVHRTLEAPVPDDAAVDCTDLTKTVVERHRAAHPDADIHLEAAPNVTAAATERLEEAIEEVLTNAIEHNPAPRPGVWVDVAPATEPGWTDVVVADDGPPIPAGERAVINGEADVSPLQHGTGLGLWLVRWTVERFGGTVSVERQEGRGNEVRLRLPD